MHQRFIRYRHVVKVSGDDNYSGYASDLSSKNPVLFCSLLKFIVEIFENSLERPNFLFCADDFESVCKFPLMAARRPTTIQLDRLTGS